ncbi:MAG: amidohydrolase, partial [Pseudomonadota bacterium]
GGEETAPDALSEAPPEQAPVAADLVLRNGAVKTPDGWVGALAVRDGSIVAVGDAAAMEPFVGPETQTIDLAGDVVMPGLHDMHVHPIFGGVRQTECFIPQGSTLPQLQERVAACAQGTADGAWVTGGQWDAATIGEVPNRQMVDAVSGETPILLTDTSGHSALANSAALAIAGVTAATEDPPGGIIERDANGEPTGVLRETAIGLVRSFVPAPPVDALRDALLWAQQEMLSYGITAYTEAAHGFVGGYDEEFAAYEALGNEGALPHRTRVCMTWDPSAPETEEAIGRLSTETIADVRFDCVKIFLDGVPTDSHTAAMLEPYERPMEGRDDEASQYGLLLVDQDTLNTGVTKFDAMGLTVKFHAAGDAAVRAGLNAIEAARAANGDSGLRHSVGHCTFVDEADVARAAAIGATFEVSPYLWMPSPIMDDIGREIGETRMRRVWPIRDLMKSGALLVIGSDWAVVPSVNPWPAIEAMVTRQAPGGNDASISPGQAISIEEALDLFTVNGAKQMGREGRAGAIAPGMMADFIVIDRNPYEVPITDVHKVQTKRTFIGGELVFEADDV